MTVKELKKFIRKETKKANTRLRRIFNKKKISRAVSEEVEYLKTKGIIGKRNKAILGFRSKTKSELQSQARELEYLRKTIPDIFQACKEEKIWRQIIIDYFNVRDGQDNVTTHISDKYSTESDVKILIHSLINNIKTLADIDETKNELKDRFGILDKDIIIYMYNELFTALADKLNITKVLQTNDFIDLYLPKESIDAVKLFTKSYSITTNFQLYDVENFIKVRLNLKNLEEHFIFYLVRLLIALNE